MRPPDVVICAGFGEALRVLCAVLPERGVAVEAFGHSLHRDLVAAVSAVPIDDRGAVIGELRDEAAVLLTPAHQFPLGVALDPGRRREAIAWAADTGAVVIEDDYDGEFRYDRRAVGALQALGPAHVVYAGTAAKTLAPGLRIAWLVVPPALLDAVVEAKRSMGAFPAALDQLTLAELLASGAYDRQVRRARIAYRRRRDRLIARLSAQGIAVSGIAAGLHVLAHLREASEQEVIERAAERGLALSGLGGFAAPGHHGRPALVIGYGRPPEHAYTAALARLEAAFSEPLRAGGRGSRPSRARDPRRRPAGGRGARAAQS